MFSIGNHRSIVAASILLVAAIGACSSDRSIILPDATPKAPPAAPVAAVASKSRVEGYRTPGKIGEGYILNRFGRTQHVTYEVHDDLAIWQGDIVLGKPSEVSTTEIGARAITRGETRISGTPGSAQQTVFINGAGYRWPGGMVPYEIAAGLPDQARITDAFTRIEESTGGITFVPRSGQADFIKFVSSTGCSSAVGHQGGEQDINFADDCSTGNAMHETMHALGIVHEMARCDRDDFVVVTIANVVSGKEFNFDKECGPNTDLGFNYDFGSAMQYPFDAFSSNGMNTIGFAPGVTYSGTIGQRDSLSLLDRITLNWLYGPFNQKPVPIIAAFNASYDEGAPVPMDATGSTDADDKKLTYRWNFGDGSCPSFPPLADCTQAMPNHRYANDGVYKVGLFVWDGYEETATEAFVTIVNVKPDISFYGGFTFPIAEGDSLYTGGDFADPGADFWSATVNYGAGAGVQSLPLLGKNFILNHKYVDNGSFTVTVEVKDDDATSTKTATQAVVNVAPTVDAGADQTFTSGQTFNFAGSFTDPGVNDSPWNWSIDWGVGSPSTGAATARGAITASNRVCGAGTYDVILSVTDKDGGNGRDTARVSVGYVVVGLSIMPGSVPSPIALKKQGGLPTAILSTSTFDARTIDIASLRLGNEVGAEAQVAMLKGKFQSSVSDVNGDGRLDLVVTFNVPDLVANGDLTMSTTSLVLRGRQGASGDPCINFRGVGAVKVN